MSDPESGNTSLPERQMGISETPELGALEADVPNHIAPRPVTIEDVPEDERDSDSSVTMTPLQTESPPTSQATPLALVSSTGTPTTTGATMNSSRSEEEKLDDHRFQEPQWVSPRPQRRLGTNAHIAREHPPHHHPHQQNVHPLASHAEVSRYLDSMPPGGFSEPARRPLRRGQGPPSSVLSDRSSSLSPAVLRSPSLAPTHSAFPNDRFSPANNRPPWGPPEYWSEGDNPPPFQKLGSPTFPPGPGRSNNATGFPHGMPLGAPGGGGPKHFPPPSYAPPRTHPRSRQQPPPEFDQLHQPPPFAVPVHGLENGDMTGYKYLTAKLGGSLFGPPITPIYRRFEAMGHRITLQLQDELCQLEEELDGIDNFETTSRLAHGTLMPASTRAAALDDHPVAQQRLEVLSKISEKLDMYYQFLKLFRDAQCLSKPGINEVEAYKHFLHNDVHIVEEETRFLSKTEDLLSLPAMGPSFMELHASGRPLRSRDSETSTPTPGDTSRRGSLVSTSQRAEHASRSGARSEKEQGPTGSPQLPIYFAYGVLVAVLVPVMTFPVFPGFAERLIIIALVFSGVGWAMLQAGISDARRPLDMGLCAGAYVMMMAMAARICH